VLLEIAVDGASGLELARELARNTAPSLVLVDMQLPDMTGHDVLRRLRSDPATAALRCVALSANATPADIDAALAAGFAEYWTKPIDWQPLLAGIDRLLGGPAASA
jgi:CheY-like chemotaxis protein